MPDHTWLVVINGLPAQYSCSSLHDIPEVLTYDSFVELITRLQASYVCTGNRDAHFITLCESKKGKFLSIKKELLAFTDYKTVRHASCEREKDHRCTICQAYRPNLRAMYSSSQKSNMATSETTNHRFFQTPQHKRRIISLRKAMKNMRAKNQRLKIFVYISNYC